MIVRVFLYFFFFQAEDGIRDIGVTGVQTCALPICVGSLQRAIITSTQLVCRLGYVPKDDHDYNPHTSYGQSKVATEKLTRSWRDRSEEGRGGEEGRSWGAADQ